VSATRWEKGAAGELHAEPNPGQQRLVLDRPDGGWWWWWQLVGGGRAGQLPLPREGDTGSRTGRGRGEGVRAFLDCLFYIGSVGSFGSPVVSAGWGGRDEWPAGHAGVLLRAGAA